MAAQSFLSWNLTGVVGFFLMYNAQLSCNLSWLESIPGCCAGALLCASCERRTPAPKAKKLLVTCADASLA